MGTTTKGIPYPEGTDRVMDGDDAMQAIAEKVDTLLPVTATGSGTTDASGFFNVTHGLGRAPVNALVTRSTATGSLWVLFSDTYTATTIRVRATDGSGAAAPAGTVVAYRVTYVFS